MNGYLKAIVALKRKKTNKKNTMKAQLEACERNNINKYLSRNVFIVADSACIHQIYIIAINFMKK